MEEQASSADRPHPPRRPQSKPGTRDHPPPKPARKRQSNKPYETNHPAHVPVTICNRKQGHHNDRRIRETTTPNEIHHNPATPTFLQAACPALKSPHTQNMPLRIEPTGRRTHHKQAKAERHHTEKESRRPQSQNHHVCHKVKPSVCHRSQHRAKCPDINW
jgi:hypothetical protein